MQLRVGHERRKRVGELPEHAAQLVGPQPEVIVTEQRVIRALALFSDAPRIGAGELHVALQRGRESAEVILFARDPPALLPVGARAGKLGGKLFWNTTSPLPVATCDAHDVAIEIIELRPIELGQPAADVLGGAALMRDAGQGAKLLSPSLRALLRHHHQLIPADQHLDTGEV